MPSVVIVGAGVIGTSIAYHLAAHGVRDVVVLDRGDAPGGGSTPRATGGFRAQFDARGYRAFVVVARKVAAFRRRNRRRFRLPAVRLSLHRAQRAGDGAAADRE